MISIRRPRRVPLTGAPDRLLLDAEASVRATELYAQLLHARFELARREADCSRLGQLQPSSVVRTAAVSAAFQASADDALVLIDPDLAATARTIASVAREVVWTPSP